jgi:hypothetical protein
MEAFGNEFGENSLAFHAGVEDYVVILATPALADQTQHMIAFQWIVRVQPAFERGWQFLRQPERYVWTNSRKKVVRLVGYLGTFFELE